MADSIETVSNRILEFLPHGPGFRFLDRVIEVNKTQITGEYTFDPEMFFYRSHFPGKPVTPGVILIETMAQTAVVAMGLYLLMTADPPSDMTPQNTTTLFTECSAEFQREVPPGERVTIKGELVYWRMRKLRALATLYLASGEVAATATLAGIGVKRS